MTGLTGLAGLVLFVGAAFGLVFGGRRIVGKWRVRARIRARLDGLPRLAVLDEDTEGPALPGAVTRTGGSLRAALDARFPLSGGPRTALVAALAGAGLGAFTVAAGLFFGLGGLLAVAVGAGAGVAAAANVGGMLEGRQRRAYEEEFLVAVDDFQRMVHFGIGAQQAFAAVVGAVEPPLTGSLRRVSRTAELGVELARAMEDEARRVRVGELAMLSAILATQSRAGGNLSEAVANLAAMLRERLDNRMRLRAMTAESRITLIILSVVPVLAIGIQSIMQPDLVGVLLGEDARHLLGIGVGLILGGLLMARVMIARSQR